ncbi:hypothetical protein AVEN_19426-1 [Araneus ventricosus]|uniref:F-box domain-containing protein n=1 Tax=Araneus ventricosus TaxID=182803 RepID=A0A4Y2C6D2_ARAVE|nr:hypothetical protein AVEN_19426-1 [Araneus ventricosus]
MALASLHSICLHRKYGFLKEGMWKFCLTNPFSELPTQDVNKLMEMTHLHQYKDPPNIGDVILLLTSGRLTRLDLRSFYPEEEQYLIVKTKQSRAGSIFLPNFASRSKDLFIFHLVRNITSGNPYLEEFHSYIHPGFDVLRNCQNLRILKFYPSYGELSLNHFPVDLSALSSLRNLEVLHLPDMDTDTIANVLEICPKLISIGLTDSLDSVEEIHQRRLKNSSLNFDVGSHFQLRRCVWGKDSWFENRQERRVYKSGFCDKTRFAVTLCPLVQELIFYVHVKEALKELRVLKQLTLLRICFVRYKDGFVREFVALLQEIGPQLKHLSILWNENIHEYDEVPFNDICDWCPHLESLGIENFIFEPRISSEDTRNFPLKRLKLYGLNESDPESVLFLLSNFKHLEELFLEEVECFDDALLRQIFERNPLTELKVISVKYCSLTRQGYQMIMEKAPSIETVLIVVNREKYFYDTNRVFKDPNLHYLEDDYFYVKLKEFFFCRLDEKRF